MNQRIAWLAAFLVFIVTRLALLGTPALIDPSEGRFAVASQQMLISDDWITPKGIAQDGSFEPYLAKPPLFMWVSALCMKYFGINEFSARLPSLLAMCGIALLLFFLVRRYSTEITAQRASLTFLSIVGVSIFHIISLTDPILNFWATAMIVGFVLGGRWSLLSFIAAGCGLLTKGPVAVAIPGGIVFFWLLLTREWSRLKSVPWITGTACVIGVISPWLLLVEQRNPGFISYYLIEENFNRYVNPSAAIKFGSLHHEPLGMIWVYGAVLMLPWFPLLLSQSKRIFSFAEMKNSPLHALGISWMIFPLLFFTFARQILPTYAFFALPGFAILLSLFCFEARKGSYPFFKWASIVIALIIAALPLIDTGFLWRGIPLSEIFGATGWIRYGAALAGAAGLFLFAHSVTKNSLEIGMYRWCAIVLLGVAVFGPIVSDARSGIEGISLAKAKGLTSVSTSHLRAVSLVFYGQNEGIKVKIYKDFDTFLLESTSGEPMLMKRSESKKWGEEKLNQLTKIGERREWNLFQKK